MADIQLRQQVAASPDISVGRDFSDFDIWLAGQFPALSDVSVYPTRRVTQQIVLGYADLIGSLDITLELATLSATGVNPDAVVDDVWPLRIAVSLTTSLSQRIGIPL